MMIPVLSGSVIGQGLAGICAIGKKQGQLFNMVHSLKAGSDLWFQLAVADYWKEQQDGK